MLLAVKIVARTRWLEARAARAGGTGGQLSFFLPMFKAASNANAGVASTLRGKEEAASRA